MPSNHRTFWCAVTTLALLLIVVWPLHNVSAQALFPVHDGKIVFHRYTDWNAWDGQLFIFDFGTRSLDNISVNWNTVEHTTNAHFSPDGKKLVFMAVPKGARTWNSWNIYVWTLGSKDEPRELIPNNGLMDQDPKFFPDGTNVTFKLNGDVGVVNTTTGVVTKLTNQGMTSEKSMEYPTTDGKNILFVEGGEPNSYVYSMNIQTKKVTPLVQTPGVQNYYCIVRDDSTFLYARWTSATNKSDDIYLANMTTGTIRPVVFNNSGADDSDPYPVNDSLVLFSSNRATGKGGYDLWVGNLTTGETRSLSLFGVNSALQELGVCYTNNTEPLPVLPLHDKCFPENMLNQNYPNPYNPQTTITYSLHNNEHVTLTMYDVLGKEIAKLVDCEQARGEYMLFFNSREFNLPSGIYFYRIRTDTYSKTKSMMLLQ